MRREQGIERPLAARAGREQLVFVAGADEAAAREAVRALRAAAGREPLPIRSARGAPADGERGRLPGGRPLDPAPRRDPRAPRAAAPPSAGRLRRPSAGSRRPAGRAATVDAAAALPRGRASRPPRGRGDEARGSSRSTRPTPTTRADELQDRPRRRSRAAGPARARAPRAKPTWSSPAAARRSSSTRSSAIPLEADAGVSPLRAPARGARRPSPSSTSSTTPAASTSSAATSATTRARAPRAVKLRRRGPRSDRR